MWLILESNKDQIWYWTVMASWKRSFTLYNGWDVLIFSLMEIVETKAQSLACPNLCATVTKETIYVHRHQEEVWGYQLLIINHIDCILYMQSFILKSSSWLCVNLCTYWFTLIQPRTLFKSSIHAHTRR